MSLNTTDFIAKCRVLLDAKASYFDACDRGVSDDELAKHLAAIRDARAAIKREDPGFKDSEANLFAR